MDINSILKASSCSCGKNHSCDIEAVYIEKGAVARLGDLCANYGKILVVADENTYGAAGEKVKKALGDKICSATVFSGSEILIPDEKAIDTVRESLGDADLIVGIGSGVIQDLCKYVAFFAKLPYMIVATAPSMDGYASNGAAMILAGMKETVAAGLPRAIVADTDVLRDAPMEMIQAGYGDIIGKYSALCDWRLSSIVNNEYFCPYIYNTTASMIDATIGAASGLVARDEESIKILMEALVIVGIMMSFAGSSRPASGSEHHLSHFFEIVGIVHNEPYFVHGIDVAFSTVITAGLREEIAKMSFDAPQYKMPKDAYEAKMKEVYKTVADGCMALQNRIGAYKKDRMDIYRANEDEIRALFELTPGREKTQELLGLVGLDMKDFYKMYSCEKIQNAIKYAKDLKDRYTVLWMYYDLQK